MAREQPAPPPDSAPPSPDDGALVTVTTTRYVADAALAMIDRVIAETPVALVYNGIAHAVMLATPADLEDFALGFSLSEGLIAAPGDVLDLDIVAVPLGIEARLTLSNQRFAGFKATRRRLAGRTGCGLCGVESLEQALPPVGRVDHGLTITPAALAGAMAELAERQRLHQATGGVHAAAWVATDGGVRLVREDVGRHNALDKLLGALASQRAARGDGFVVITSRASHEMVQKTVRAGIELLAAVSAPTSLAVSQADAAGLTLVGWLRAQGFTAYTHPGRITG